MMLRRAVEAAVCKVMQRFFQELEIEGNVSMAKTTFGEMVVRLGWALKMH